MHWDCFGAWGSRSCCWVAADGKRSSPHSKGPWRRNENSKERSREVGRCREHGSRRSEQTTMKKKKSRWAALRRTQQRRPDTHDGLGDEPDMPSRACVCAYVCV